MAGGRRKVFGPALPPAMVKARRAARRAANKAKKSTTVALIKSVIARQEETKFVSDLVANRVGQNSQIGFSDLIPCLPRITQDQGTGSSYERLGRKISVRRSEFHIDIGMADVSRGNNIIVHMWILTNKQVKKYNLLSSTNTLTGGLLLAGSSSNYQAYNGYAQDSMLPINSSQFGVLHHKKFFLGKNTGTLQDSTTAGNQPAFTHALNKRFVFKLKCPKVWTYEQDEGVPRTEWYPNNWAPFCVIGYQHVSNTDPDYYNQDLTVTARANVHYDDA